MPEGAGLHKKPRRLLFALAATVALGAAGCPLDPSVGRVEQLTPENARLIERFRAAGIAPRMAPGGEDPFAVTESDSLVLPPGPSQGRASLSVDGAGLVRRSGASRRGGSSAFEKDALAEGVGGPGEQLRDPSGPRKVQVLVSAEAGCPDTSTFLSETLRGMLQHGLTDVMNFTYVPFGNAYYATEECGGEPFNEGAVECWLKRCGAAAGAAGLPRPADCFTGDPICQHGKRECEFNKMHACAKSASGDDPGTYMPFVTCTVENFTAWDPAGWKESRLVSVVQLADSCLKATSFSAHAKGRIARCFASEEGERLLASEAAATPLHPGVPYVEVNGRFLQQTSDLMHYVCDLYKGESPAACHVLTLSGSSASGGALPDPDALDDGVAPPAAGPVVETLRLPLDNKHVGVPRLMKRPDGAGAAAHRHY